MMNGSCAEVTKEVRFGSVNFKHKSGGHKIKTSPKLTISCRYFVSPWSCFFQIIYKLRRNIDH